MDRAIRGATKPKNAAPKKKYLDILIPATTSDISLQEIFVALHHRLKEHSWTVVFKSLIVIHILMRQGTKDNVLKYLASERNIMNVSRFKDKSGPHHQAKNIHAYAAYLDERINTYRELRFDLAKTNPQPGRLRKLTVAKGLLREVKILQRQMGALLKCKFFLDEINNEVTLTAFKLLVQDLLALFQAVNEGVINVLEQYCEMSLVDAKDALEIYKEFVKQTEGVVDFLNVAKKLQNELKMTIPNLKHAPVSMTVTLEDYVNDPDFEKNREEYERSKLGKPNEDKQSTQSAFTTNPSEAPKATQTNVDDSAIKRNVATAQSSEKNIFDFFASIEQEQTLIFGNQYNTGSFGRTSTNPFIAMQQQQQQQQMMISQQALLQQQMSQLTLQQPLLQQSTIIPDTNPFRTSVLASSVTSSAASSNFNPFQPQMQQQNLLTPTNPFTTMNHSSSLQPLKTEDNNPFRRLSSASNFDSMQPFPPLQQQQSLNTTLGGNSSSTTSFTHIQSASNAFGAGF